MLMRVKTKHFIGASRVFPAIQTFGWPLQVFSTLQMPTTDKNTEASRRVSGDPQQKRNYFEGNYLTVNLRETFCSILLNSSFDFNSFFFQLTSGFSMPWQKNHGWWSSASREDCLNLEPLSISVTSCADSQLSFLLPPIDSSPFVSLHSYFCFKCRRIVMISMFNQNQEVFTQWKFKEQDVFHKKPFRSHLCWHVVIGYSHFGGWKHSVHTYL